MGSWNGRGNRYIQFIRVLYCKKPTNGKQLPAFTLEAVQGTEARLQRWEARVATVAPFRELEDLMEKYSTDAETNQDSSDSSSLEAFNENFLSSKAKTHFLTRILDLRKTSKLIIHKYLLLVLIPVNMT